MTAADLGRWTFEDVRGPTTGNSPPRGSPAGPGANNTAELVLLLPIRTISENNAHEHWRVRHARRKQQDMVVTCLLQSQIGDAGRDLGPPCRVTLTRIAPRRLDDDNNVGSMKQIRDSIAAVLGVDDGSPLYDWRYDQRRGEPGVYAVEMRISVTP